MRMYCVENTVVGKSERKLLKSSSNFFVYIAMYISKAIPQRCLKNVFKLYSFKENLRQILTRRSEQISENDIKIGGGERVVPLESFSRTAFGIYQWSFRFRSTLLVELTEAHYESVKWAAGFGKDETKEEVSREVPKNAVLKARLRQSLSSTQRAGKRTAQNIFI